MSVRLSSLTGPDVRLESLTDFLAAVRMLSLTGHVGSVGGLAHGPFPVPRGRACSTWVVVARRCPSSNDILIGLGFRTDKTPRPVCLLRSRAAKKSIRLSIYPWTKSRSVSKLDGGLPIADGHTLSLLEQTP